MAGIVVVGGSDFVLGFRLAGIRSTVAAQTTAETEHEAIKILQARSASILVLSDGDYRAMPPATRRRLEASVEPVVISVGKMDEENIREKIKRAIGIDLYKKK